MKASKPQQEQIILGIDPGTVVMGYGVIVSKGQQIKLECLGSIKLDKFANQQLKLAHIFDRVSYLVETYTPDSMSIEAPFYGKNVQSMLKLGRAQGVCMAAALSRQVPVMEYAPRRIKQAVTGNGNASKEQVAAILQQLCKMDSLPKMMDATDALAAAVCHHFSQGRAGSGKGNYSGWEDFARKNSKRVN